MDSAGAAPGGNILIFNNGNEYEAFRRGYSSVVEIVPPVDGYDYRREPAMAYGPAAPVWTYTAETPEDFYAPVVSGAQRLPNGNTLITSGTQGILFEVTPEGETVWKYISPAAKVRLRQGAVPEPRSNCVYRSYRYAPDYPGLQGLDLTPGETIEIYGPP